MAAGAATIKVAFDIKGNMARELRDAAEALVPLEVVYAQPIDRDELKAVIMSCGPDPAAAEVADAVVAWLGVEA